MKFSLTDEFNGPQLDITQPDKAVELEISADRRTLWVNVDGVMRLRIQQIPRLELTDQKSALKRVLNAGRGGI